MQSGPIYTAAYIFIGCKFLTEQLFAKVEIDWVFELCDPASPFCSYLTFTKTGRVFAVGQGSRHCDRLDNSTVPLQIRGHAGRYLIVAERKIYSLISRKEAGGKRADGLRSSTATM